MCIRDRKWTKDETATATDVAKILVFLADFLHNGKEAKGRIELLVTATGEETGLILSLIHI